MWSVLAALLLAVDGGAPRAPEPPLRVSVRGASTLVLKGTRAHAVKLPSDEFDGLSDARIEFIQRAPDALYLLLWTQELSGGRPEGQCGAGEEDEVVWLELAPNFTVRQGQAVQIESCWQTITSDEKCVEQLVAGKPCGFTLFAAGGAKGSIAFDPAHPERGLTVTGAGLHRWSGTGKK